MGRVAARVHYLLHHPTPVRVILAPFFCLGYFGAPRRRRQRATAAEGRGGFAFGSAPPPAARTRS